MFRNITRNIWLLSLVSLFTDMASEMLYPVMPVYLKHIGFSVFMIGILEGIAEAVAGLSKSYFGGLSDKAGKRLPFVQMGYALSAISKPMMALFTNIPWIFSARTTDRLGKGIRTAARDALLYQEAKPGERAAVFGFHRAMDTMGAVLGPILALVFLYFYPGEYKTMFLLAFIPGLLAIVFTLFIKEIKNVPAKSKRVGLLFAFQYWKESTPQYKKLVTALLIFALINSSDLLLLLKIKEDGYSDRQVISVYIFYNLIYALLAFPMGRWADRIGLKKVFLLGLFFFIATYSGFAFSQSIPVYLFLFFCYGIYAAATEGISKAWISGLVQKEETASAIGTFTGFQSIAALISSSLAGFLWFQFGAKTAFLFSAITALLLLIYFWRLEFVREDNGAIDRPETRQEKNQ
jgi:MFS family permease